MGGGFKKKYTSLTSKRRLKATNTQQDEADSLNAEALSTHEEGDDGRLHAAAVPAIASTTTNAAALLGLQPALQQNNDVQDRDAVAHSSATYDATEGSAVPMVVEVVHQTLEELLQYPNVTDLSTKRLRNSREKQMRADPVLAGSQRAADNLRQKRKRDNELAAATAIRLATEQHRSAEARLTEASDQTAIRQTADASGHARRRRNEPAAATAIRLATKKHRSAEARFTETSDQTEQRQAADASGHYQARLGLDDGGANAILGHYYMIYHSTTLPRENSCCHQFITSYHARLPLATISLFTLCFVNILVHKKTLLSTLSCIPKGNSTRYNW